MAGWKGGGRCRGVRVGVRCCSRRGLLVLVGERFLDAEARPSAETRDCDGERDYQRARPLSRGHGDSGKFLLFFCLFFISSIFFRDFRNVYRAIICVPRKCLSCVCMMCV